MHKKRKESTLVKLNQQIEELAAEDFKSSKPEDTSEEESEEHEGFQDDDVEDSDSNESEDSQYVKEN
jgi:hypothetical protein